MKYIKKYNFDYYYMYDELDKNRISQTTKSKEDIEVKITMNKYNL